MGNVFDAFRTGGHSRCGQESTTEMLMTYEEHYMRLVKNFRPDIEFINGLHERQMQEVKNFYANELPAIIKKLDAEPIENDVRNEWIKHFEEHMEKFYYEPKIS